MADLGELQREVEFAKRLLASSQDSSGVQFARYSKPDPSATLADLLAKSNTALPVSSVTPRSLPPRYLPRNLNAAGYTISKGPLQGQVIVAGEEPSMDQVNTQGHEAYHQRVLENGGMPDVHGTLGSAGAETIGNGLKFRIAELMRQFQSPDKSAPHWGLNPSSNAQEQIASIAGYEGMQPKGTAMKDTAFGKKLEENGLLNYYLTQSSVPYGGVWEGQSSDPRGATERVQQFLKSLMLRGGLNTVNR